MNAATGTASVAIGAGNSASGNYGVAIGGGNVALGQYSTAMGAGCSANGHKSFADGSGCVADGLCSVAMGESCDASGDNSVALGRYCTTEPSGFASVCLGNICRTYDNATVALGSSARASGRKTITHVASNVDISNVFFVYRSSLGNSVEFVDATEVSQTGTAADFGTRIGLRYRSYDGSASELIYAAPAGSGGGASSLSFRVVYSTPAQVSTGATLTAITTTFPSLPNDNRVVSVTAWCGGDGTYVGTGVTFNIPSSEFRTWYWGCDAIPTGTNLWNNSSASNSNQNYEGFFWNARGAAGTCAQALGGVGGATDVLYWNTYGAMGGDGTNSRVPGAASNGYVMFGNFYNGAGIKVQWIG